MSWSVAGGDCETLTIYSTPKYRPTRLGRTIQSAKRKVRVELAICSEIWRPTDFLHLMLSWEESFQLAVNQIMSVMGDAVGMIEEALAILNKWSTVCFWLLLWAVHH
jgi:hypothetical protein